MNILLLTDKLNMGGAEMYYCKLENYLYHPEITFYYAAAKGELYKKIKNKHHFTELSRTNHIQNIRRLVELVKEREINIIHANSLRMVVYSVLVKKLIGNSVKIFYTKHNVTILEQKLPRGFRYLINKYVDRVITVSGFEKLNLEQLGIINSKIKTIYNGVDLKQFIFQRKVTGEVFNIGILARLSEEKNHELFIKIANDLREISTIMFHIAGDGPEKKNIANMIQSLNLSHKVKLRGEVEDPENFIREMDLLLLTSYREVFPMVILESMAVGTPIVSIDRGGVKEAVIENQTGVLIKNHSSDEFSKRIISLKSNPQTRMKITEQARQKVEREFSLDKMLQKTLEEYLHCS